MTSTSSSPGGSYKLSPPSNTASTTSSCNTSHSRHRNRRRSPFTAIASGIASLYAVFRRGRGKQGKNEGKMMPGPCNVVTAVSHHAGDEVKLLTTSGTHGNVNKEPAKETGLAFLESTEAEVSGKQEKGKLFYLRCYVHNYLKKKPYFPFPVKILDPFSLL